MKKTSKILSVILAMLMVISIIPITASAEKLTSGPCGYNLTWTVDESTGTLTISGTGAMYDYNSNNRPWESYEDKIKVVVIDAGVTTIGEYAFNEFDYLTTVTISDSVTDIGSSAFEWCKSLKNISLPSTLTSIAFATFRSCYRLENIVIPDSVTSIGGSAFENCDNLKSIEIPGSVDVIGYQAFESCSSLEEVVLHEGLKQIEYYAFWRCGKLASIELPSTLTYIGSWAFQKTGFTDITIPVSVTSFGSGVFTECPNLTDVTFADGTKSISAEIFSWCPVLKNVNIPNTVETINSAAFYGCFALKNVYFDGTVEDWLKITFTDAKAQPLYYADNLYCKDELITEVVVPENITTINAFAFYDYDKLTSVKISSTVKTVNNSAFADCSGLTNLVIEEGVSTFDSLVFSNCDALTSVTIPGSLKSIGNSVFQSCDALTKVIFAEGCTSTGTKTFYYCDSLKEVVLPTSMATIGENAFSECISLEKISIPANVATIGSKAFELCESLTEITVDDENKNFSSEDGVLFNKNKTILIHYPIGKPEKSYKIPDGVTTLQKYAFENSNLKSVIVPTSVSQIYGYAFCGCDNFTDIYYSGTKTQWDAITKDKYYDEYLGEAILHCEYESGDYKYTVISEADKTIRITKYDVYDTTTELVIPSVIDGYTVTEIGPSVFEGKTQFTNIVIPDTVTKIDERAFYQCTGLTKIVIPESVTEISADAFYGCYNLSRILFNSGINTIGKGAFNKCTRLAYVYYTGTEAQWNSVTIDADNEPLINATKHFEYTDDYVSDSGTCGDNLTWKFNPFTGTLTISGTGNMYNYTSSNGAPWKTYGSKIENVVICEGVTSIGEYAFLNCKTFKNISMADSVTAIGSYAFYNCNGLTDIVIGKGVKKLNRYTFYCCSALKTITFDKNVKSIHQDVAVSCSILTDVYYLGSREDWNDTTVGYNCFWPGEIYILGDDTHECSNKFIYDSVVTAPTCTEKGYTTYFCRCGKTRIDDYVDIDKNNHSYTSEMTTPATHIATGVMTYTCSCGDTYTEVIEKLEKHNYESVVTAPTCTERGYTTHTCICGDSYVGDYAEALGHIDNDNNNCCDKCSKYILPTSGTYGDNVTWTFDESTGTLTFSGTGEMQYATSHGVPWHGHINSIERVVISEGVTTIGDKVFYNHKNIKNVSIADSVTDIDERAFYNCTGLTDVVIGKGVTTIGEFAFQNCSNLKTVTIYNAVEEICRYAFNGCSKLTDVYYLGTEAEWNAITKGDLLSKTGLEKATIHFLGEETHECSYNAVVTSPTCTEQGYTTYTCECGDSYVDDYVNATGHSHTSEVTTPATHTETGIMTYTCVCGDTYTEAIEKLEKHNYESVVTAPTCTERGYTTYTCECNDSYVDNYVDAKGHNHTSEITTPATHTTTGIMTYTCACGDSYTEVIAKLEKHNYEAVVTAPTCTEQGYTTYTCECGDTYVDDYVDALGHTSSTAVEENYVAPSCIENGSKDVVVYCSVCNEEINRETVVIDATGHNYTAVTTAPTCTEQGYTTYTCDCGETYVDNYVNATGHADNDGDGYCDECDEELEFIVLCDHNCHKGGISGFFWKISNFFNRIFGLKKYCECGAAHY